MNAADMELAAAMHQVISGLKPMARGQDVAPFNLMRSVVAKAAVALEMRSGHDGPFDPADFIAMAMTGHTALKVVDGIRPHRQRTPYEIEQARVLAERAERPTKEQLERTLKGLQELDKVKEEN